MHEHEAYTIWNHTCLCLRAQVQWKMSAKKCPHKFKTRDDEIVNNNNDCNSKCTSMTQGISKNPALAMV